MKEQMLRKQQHYQRRVELLKAWRAIHSIAFTRMKREKIGSCWWSSGKFWIVPFCDSVVNCNIVKRVAQLLASSSAATYLFFTPLCNSRESIASNKLCSQSKCPLSFTRVEHGLSKETRCSMADHHLPMVSALQLTEKHNCAGSGAEHSHLHIACCWTQAVAVTRFASLRRRDKRPVGQFAHKYTNCTFLAIWVSPDASLIEEFDPWKTMWEQVAEDNLTCL